MRKNHHGKKDRLVKRVFALCLALAVICTCLVPVFATEGLIDPQVNQEASRPVDDGVASYPDDEFAGFGEEEATRPVDGGEAAGFGGDEVATRPVEGGEDNLDGGPNVKETEWGTVIDYSTSSSTDTSSSTETQWSGEDDVVEKPDDKVVVSGDEIKKLQDMVVYRFWLRELNTLDLQDITAQAQINNMTESEYLARNGEVLWGLYFIQAVPRTETIADYSSYIENPSSNRDPKGELRLFDYWYTLDEFGNRVRLNLTDPTSNILDDKTTTVNVYAAWKDGTVGSDEEEKVDHEDLVDKNPVPVDLTAKAAASYEDEEGELKTTTLPVEVKNLPSAAHSLSVIHMGDDDMESFYESHEDSFGEMMPILGLKISPKNAKGETVQPAKGEKATVTVSGLDKLPEMEGATADTLKVFHETSDGNVEILDVLTYTNGTLTFETSSFSPFVLALTGGYDTELLDERASDGYVPLYLYALKPGLVWQGNSTKNNNNWYGIGIAKIKPRCYQRETTDSTYIKDKISSQDILLEPFSGDYKYNLSELSKKSYTGKALYPKIGMDKMSVVDADKPGYTYWDGNGNMPTSYYYRVEWFHLTKELGAPASGYNEPAVSTIYHAYHLDARITFSDMCNVDFMVKEPGKENFERLDVRTYSAAYSKGTSESYVIKPQDHGYNVNQFSGYVFSGWYTDEACTQKAEFNGTIDGDKIYYGKYIPGGNQLQPDTAFIKVEKKVTGITRAEMNPQFKVTMSGNGLTYDLTLGGSTTIPQSDGSFVLRWTVPDMKPGKYTITESGTEVANYTCNASGMVGESVDVEANNLTVETNGGVITSCANQVFPIGEDGDENRIFVVSGTSQINVVVSFKPLSLSERTSVINALKQLTGEGTSFKNQADNTTFYSINAANSERIQINSTILSYDSGAKTVTVVEPSGWKKALMLSYDVQDANNPEVKITNDYTLATADIEVGKLVTGMMGSLEKAFTFQIDGLPNTSKVVQNDVEKAVSTSFTMKSGDSVTLKNVPVGTVFAVKETGTDAKDYQTTATGYIHVTDIQSGESDRVFYYVVRYENGQRVLKPCDVNGENERNALGEFKIQVTNHCGLLPDTGVLLDTLPYIVILAVVAGGVALLMLRKRRKEDD